MKKTLAFDSYNAAYVQQVYEEYLRNPSAVEESWRRLFASEGAQAAGLIPAPVEARQDGAPSQAHLRAAVAAAELVDAYRLHGHRAAHLDPLGTPPAGHPLLEPERHGTTRAELGVLPASLLGLEQVAATMADAVDWLDATYTGTIGYEFEHIEDPARREWLREQIESGAHRRTLEPDEQKRLLQRLSEVEALEQFLHRAYLGAKRFSVEGTDMLVPMLDLAIEHAAAAGAREVVLGMAHRGRLNVLAHVLGRPYQALIAEFEGIHGGFGTTGDVKYHLGAEGTYATRSGEPLNVTLMPNPSHLEFVDPVVEGVARAKQTDRSGRSVTQDQNVVLPVLIHGDAAFAAQGVVAETLNMSQLNGYCTGGTLHLIANNQIGFTTTPEEARSTPYASGLARGFDIPIFHVNADDPEACLDVVRLALAFRAEFHADVVIDLIGYRRYGHNEADEPAYTQPTMYRRIGEHAPVRRLWGETLIARKVLEPAGVEELWNAAYQRLADAQEEVKSSGQDDGNGARPFDAAGQEGRTDTAVRAERLLALDAELHEWPDGFSVNPKLRRQLERRARVLPEGGSIDWAHAETLAFASLLTEGVPIRLTGQDVARGTFSQRHLVLHDVETGANQTPVAALSGARAAFEVYNSPLSEMAAVGFEYGYSIAAPETLVLWEAQFGDFANGAQVIIDQFIAAGRAKWGQLSGLGLLLPHGYEGQGPEHSSARIERFLQLGGEHNLRLAYCTTPAQYFHLLRRQALDPDRRPLVVFTPKSLLRHPRAVSKLEGLSEGRFMEVIDDGAARQRPGEITRVALCTGKVYYDLVASTAREESRQVAVVRLEQLYPFPAEELRDVLAGYPALEEVVWVQEEPRNMGAWPIIDMRILGVIEDRLRLGYAGRPERASPAEGYASLHERSQTNLVEQAFGEYTPVAREGRPVFPV